MKVPFQERFYPGREEWIKLPCGKCPPCRSLSRMDWFFRLKYEKLNARHTYWLTLTYDDMFLPVAPFTNDAGVVIDQVAVLKPSHFTAFIKALRKKVEPFKLRFFGIGEYGSETYRPHYHLLLFCEAPLPVSFISHTWQYGNIRCTDTVLDAQINYCALDVLSFQDDETIEMMLELGLQPPFRRMSRNPGIGFVYLHDKELVNFHRDSEMYGSSTILDEVRYRLPRYIKDRMYSDVELKSIFELNVEREKSNEELEQRVDPDSIEKFRRIKGEAERIRMLYKRKLKTKL